MKKSDTNIKKITGSAMALSMISAFGLVFSFLQEALLAYFFGTTGDSDAYVIAIQLPVIVFSVISTSISTIIIPKYSSELFSHGKESARRYASNFMSAISLVTIGIIIVCELFAKQIIGVLAPGLETSIRELTIILFRIILPTVLFTELININIGILNVHKSFLLPALASNFLNIGFLGIVFFLARSIGIYAAILGTAVGTVMEFAYTLFLRRKYMKYSLVLDLSDKKMKESISMAVPVFIGIGADEVSKIVDKIVSSFLSEGSISSLNYASRLTSAVSSLLISGISTVIYPEFAKHAAEKNKGELANTLIFSIKLYLFVIIPVIVGGCFCSETIIKVVFGRGSFDGSSIGRTAPLFSCYLVCLLFTAIRTASSRYFYSQGDSKTPMKNSIIGICVNIILNIVLVKYFDTLGLALATTVSMGLIALLILVDAKKTNNNIKYSDINNTLLKSIISASVMLIILFLQSKIPFAYSLINMSGTLHSLLYLIIQILMGCIVYFGCQRLLKSEEVSIILSIIKGRGKA